MGWGENTVQAHHLSGYSHYLPAQLPAIVRVSTVNSDLKHALVRYAYCVNDIINRSHSVVYSVILRHLMHQPNANESSHVSRVLI